MCGDTELLRATDHGIGVTASELPVHFANRGLPSSWSMSADYSEDGLTGSGLSMAEERSGVLSVLSRVNRVRALAQTGAAAL